MEGNSQCLDAALRLLKASDKLESELRQALERKGYGAEDVASVIQHLIRRKLLDDRRSITNLIARKSGRRAVGIEKFRAELIRRGAPEEIIDECLGQIAPTEQREAMLAALSAKFKPHDDRARGARFLLGRGFAEDDIESVLNEFFQQD